MSGTNRLKYSKLLRNISDFTRVSSYITIGVLSAIFVALVAIGVVGIIRLYDIDSNTSEANEELGGIDIELMNISSSAFFINTSMAYIVSGLGEITDAIYNMTIAVVMMSESVENITIAVDNITEVVSSLGSAVDSIDSGVQDINAAMGNITDSIDNVTEVVSSLGPTIDNIDSELTNISSNIESLTDNLSSQISYAVNNFAIPSGEEPGYSVIHKYGFNPDQNGPQETIWTGGGLYPYLTVGEILRINSTSASDTLGGSGSHTVRLFGVNESGIEITEDIDMDGTSYVFSTLEFYRIYRVRVIQAGASRVNEGTIVVEAANSTVVQGIIAIDQGSTQLGIYTIPSNKEGFLMSFTASSEESSGSGRQHIYMYTRNTNTTILFGDWGMRAVGTSEFTQDFKIPLYLAPMTDIEFRSSSTSSNAAMSIFFIVVTRLL